MPAATMASIPSQHAAGIFANRNLDGPEIGTLVIVVDRAKNLPNLRTMGKQNPYCAARLGKMALKTEVDHRGGQTPKWDQELRFTVHESLDYQKLKVSVFNEDKKTDLVGETFISLEDVLRRGGGQNDAWHELHNKGKYAGQIRIELTFYDSRPREERHPPQQDPRLSSNEHAAASAAEQPRHSLGPRDPTSRRRPVPQPDPAFSVQGDLHESLETIPLPQQGPRSFHTPPRVASMADLHPEDAALPQSYLDQYAPASAYLRPAHAEVPHPSHQDYMYEEPAANDNDLFAYPDDPYALEAAHVGAETEQEPQQQAYTPYRHDRISQLSGAPRSRPAPSNAIPHAHSAPVLSPHHRQQAPRQAPNPRPNPEDIYGHSYNPPYQSFAATQAPHLAHAQRTSAPPPPRHTNSAPEPQQVAHVASSPYSTAEGMRHGARMSWSDSYQHPRSPEQSYSQQVYAEPSHHTQIEHDAMRRRSANSYPDFQHYEDPSPVSFEDVGEQAYYDQSLPSLQPATPQRISRSTQAPVEYQDPAVHDQTPHHISSSPGPAIVRPRAISPNRPQQRQPQAIPRKSVSSSPLGAPNQPSSTPFSPDSFDAFNPSINQAAPPAFGAQHSSPLVSSQSTTPAERVPVPEPGGQFRDAHGRPVDPSDHLPASTHAPEPEKKGADKHRATITATVKTRFGPREARPAHVVATRTSHYAAQSHTPSPLSSPATPSSSAPHSAAPSPLQQREAMAAAARQRLQKRSPAGSSPLAPSAPAALNQASPLAPRAAYHQNGPGAPPVPMKIPLDAPYPPGAGYEGGGAEPAYAGRDALSQEMANIDLGPSPLQSLEVRYGGVGGQRARRSRFGA